MYRHLFSFPNWCSTSYSSTSRFSISLAHRSTPTFLRIRPTLPPSLSFFSNSTTSFMNSTNPYPGIHRFLHRFANGKQPNESGYYKEIGIIFTVFAITGSSSMKVVRYTLNSILGEGSIMEGPNSWRLAYVLCGLPIYSLLLITLGTLSGRGAYFRAMLLKMYSRFLPKKMLPSSTVSAKRKA